MFINLTKFIVEKKHDHLLGFNKQNEATIKMKKFNISTGLGMTRKKILGSGEELSIHQIIY